MQAIASALIMRCLGWGFVLIDPGLDGRFVTAGAELAFAALQVGAQGFGLLCNPLLLAQFAPLGHSWLLFRFVCRPHHPLSSSVPDPKTVLSLRGAPAPVKTRKPPNRPLQKKISSSPHKGLATTKTPCHKARLDGDRAATNDPDSVENKRYAAVAQG
jgi:hypothetical protein